MEQLRNNRKLIMVAVLASIVSAVVAGGLANLVNASTPDVNGRINACYTTEGGDLRVIDTLDTCSNTETSLNWQANSARSAVVVIDDERELDLTHSRGILSSLAFDENSALGHQGFCLELGFLPLVASQPSLGGNLVFRDGISAQTAAGFNDTCSDSKYTAAIYADAQWPAVFLLSE